MVNSRNTNEIISSLIDFYKLTKPELDSKPGTVVRDIFISPLANQLSLLYDQINTISSKQSLRFIIGSDLDKFAKNFGISRKQASYSSGVALLTFKSVDGNISINKGDVLFSSNGVSFTVTSANRISSANSNFYRSIAIKYKADLDLLGITDLYAIEVPVTCSTAGTAGNISKYSLSSSNINGVSNVTNTVAFVSGTDAENDSIFKNRILATFSGSSIGTSLGYLNAASSVNGVLDVYIAEPNDPLMQRDGTVVEKNVDGSLTITKEGSGGKVDVIVLGSNLVEATDTFIYIDKSNKLDPTDSKNNYVLGQIIGDSSKTISKKRVDNLVTGILPTQPVNNVVEVSGSLSGSNFKEKTIDSNGIVSGNYEIVKDSGYYSGTPWGFDTFKWISNEISDFQEDKIKSQAFGQDQLNFSGVNKISSIEQQVLITNENSKPTGDRSILQLLHYPCTSVTRVYNTNTGERYIVSNQNFDGYGSVNLTGRIKITGGTLPSSTDILQVDYTWIVDYDPNIDFDGLQNNSNIRVSEDSIDWGLSSNVNEKVKMVLDTTGTFYSGTTTLPISSVVSCNMFKFVSGSVYKINSGKYINRLAIDIENLISEPTKINSIKLKNTETELFDTRLNNGEFSTTSYIYFDTIVYSSTIILPSDTFANENDLVDIFYNYSDVFTVDQSNGSSSNFTLSIPVGNVSETLTEFYSIVSYITSSSLVYSGAISSLPASKESNGFINGSALGSRSINLFNQVKSENLIVQLNTDGDLYVELSSSNDNSFIDGDSVLSIVRISDGLEFWNKNNQGSVTTSTDNKYQLIFSGYNSPLQGDRVLALYYPKELNRIQNLNFYNEVLSYSIEKIKYNGSNYYIEFNDLIGDSNLSYSISNINDGYEYFSGSDGYLNSTTFSSSTSFLSLPNVTSLKLNITDGYSQGEYFIDSINNDGSIEIFKQSSNLNLDNFFAYRLLDGKEMQIKEYNNPNVIFEGSFSINENVIIASYNFKSIRKSPSRFNLTLTDNVVNPGTVTLFGPVLQKGKDVVFTKTTNTNIIDLTEAIKSITSNFSSAKLVKLVSLEKVTLTNNIVTSVDYTFDLKNNQLKNYFYFNESVKNNSLSNYQVTVNSSNTPTNIGDRLRATFYIIADDSESLNFTRNGSQYTNKKFLYLNKITSSGFRASQSTRLSVSLFNQPNVSSRYKVKYNYTAPKQNERITIRYNYNKLINDVTFAIEKSRPINSDVLVKQASQVDIGLTIEILVNTSTGLDENTIKQNVNSAVLAYVNLLELGRTIQDIDIQLASDNVEGVDRTRVLYFNKYGELGSLTKIIAQNNEYFNLKELTINIESR